MNNLLIADIKSVISRLLIDAFNSILYNDNEDIPLNRLFVTLMLHSYDYSCFKIRRLRYSAYKGAILFIYGKLGYGRRFPVPACIGR